MLRKSGRRRCDESLNRWVTSSIMAWSVIILCIVGVSMAAKETPPPPSHKKSSNNNNNKGAAYLSANVTKLISQQFSEGAEQIKQRQKAWKKTLEEIKDLVVPNQKLHPTAFFDQWKELLEQQQQKDTISSTSTPSKRKRAQKMLRRFDGFVSWDNLLQQWSEDVAEYLEDKETALSERHDQRGITDVTEQTALRTTSVLPIPAPAKPGEPVLDHTDLADKSKRVWIVTTAALPWMTGTAVNPLLRAAYLTKGRAAAGGGVTLMLPWLERRSDAERVYGKGVFETPEQQEAHIRDWLRNTANLPEASEELNIAWYTAWQERAENSVYSMGDITATIPEEDVDICILEEPEHLNWYRASGESWTRKFKHVVGIVHTNYFVYAQEQPAALIRAPAMKLLCSWMCRAHSHRLIKLSGTLGQFAPEKEVVENVHGVRQTFLDVGEELRKRLVVSKTAKTDPVFGPEADPSVYFIGKMLWSKGIGSLMELLVYAEESAGLKVKVDMYGGGPNKQDAETKSQRLGLDMPFHGPVDHAKLAWTHKVFVNPSTSEVLCTTVAEALAMGKFVVVPSHPSNDFFAQFPNCLPYADKEEFVGNLYYALTHSPEPLSEQYAYALSWQAATERLEAAAAVSVAEHEAMSEALESADAGVEINLPPLLKDEKQRKLISESLRRSRGRYRQFRSRLSQELQSNAYARILPKDIQERLLKELDKRLDIDIDTFLESPKLRLKLSPAELDKQLLELYVSFSQSPGADVLRYIGGGTDVGQQNYYLKQQALKQKREERKRKRLEEASSKQQSRKPLILSVPAIPSLLALEEYGDEEDDDDLTPAKRVQKALRRNFPVKVGFSGRSRGSSQGSPSTVVRSNPNKDNMTMCHCLATSSRISETTCYRRAAQAPLSFRPPCPARVRKHTWGTPLI